MKRKKGLLMITGSLLLILGGCSGAGNGNPGKGDPADTRTAVSDQGVSDQASAGEESGQKESGSQGASPDSADQKNSGEGAGKGNAGDKGVSAGGIMRTDVDGKPYTWQEITVTIPSQWEDRIEIVEFENGNGFSIFQKMSYEKDKEMGYLCGFMREDSMLFMGAGERALAFTDDNVMYYLMQPTDVSYYYEDKNIQEDYLDLNSMVFAAASSIQIDRQGVHYNPEEYMLPLSGTVEIAADDLINFSDNELWIARNEIYARHGRIFANDYLNNYFAACTWYEGTADADNFQDSVLSQVEKANLEKIKAQEKIWKEQNPYPMEYSADQAVQVDLNNDGKREEITYTAVDKPVITVNEVEFPLDFYGINMTDPEKEVFYISSITEGYQYDGREIAVIDYGENGNAATYFFTYHQLGLDTGTLDCIGHIEGIPFKQKTGINGFPFYGRLEGVRRTKILDDASMYVGWWYDTQNKILTENTGYYQMVPDGGRLLEKELQVYGDRAEDSPARIIPAGERIFFLWTDDGEWIEVKSKSGVTGYVHVKDGKVLPGSGEVKEVFTKAGE